MCQSYRDKQLSTLKQALLGNEITDVLPANADERVCILQYRTPEGQVGSIQIGATDLGWWVEDPGVGEKLAQEYRELDERLKKQDEVSEEPNWEDPRELEILRANIILGFVM